MENKKIGKNVRIHPTALIYPNVVLHDNVFIGPYCIIGEPTGDYYKDPDNHEFKKTEIGENSVIRSHSIIYEDVNIGKNFQTGHHVTIREGSIIGHDCSVGTLSDIQGRLKIGNYVRMHSNVFIPELTTIGDYVWIFPHAVITNDPYPPVGKMVGCNIENYAILAAGSTILPGVKIGENSLVGAGSVVTKDVEDGKVVIGNPAKLKCDINNLTTKDGEELYPWKNHIKTYRGYPWQKQ